MRELWAWQKILFGNGKIIFFFSFLFVRRIQCFFAAAREICLRLGVVGFMYLYGFELEISGTVASEWHGFVFIVLDLDHMIRVGKVGLRRRRVREPLQRPFFMENKWLLLNETIPMSCLELKIEYLALDEVERPNSFPTFSIVARCNLHVICICSLYPQLLHCSVGYTLSDRPHTNMSVASLSRAHASSFNHSVLHAWGIGEQGPSRILAYFPEWALLLLILRVVPHIL